MTELDDALYRQSVRGWLPVSVPYAEALVRAAGCTDPQVLLGWLPERGPRCRLCGTVAVLPTVRLWEALAEWRKA